MEEQLTSRMEVAKAAMTVLYEDLTELQRYLGVQLDEDAKPILNFGLCSVVRVLLRLSFPPRINAACV